MIKNKDEPKQVMIGVFVEEAQMERIDKARAKLGGLSRSGFARLAMAEKMARMDI